MHLIHPETPACLSDACRQMREPCPTPMACRWGARHVEAAHAASEYPDHEPLHGRAVIAWWLPAIVPIAGVTAAALLAAYWDTIAAWLWGVL